jgi:hypothetical protein
MTERAMPELETESRLADPDRAYRMLIDAHRGLSEEESAALNTRLVLILANHIGDDAALAEALDLARRASRPTVRTSVAEDGRGT